MENANNKSIGIIKAKGKLYYRKLHIVETENNCMGKIGEIQRGAFEKIVVTLTEPKGKQRIDIRTYSLSDQGEPDNWLASKKGINISADEWTEFKQLVDKVDQSLKEKQ